jgi:hypothetical protein
MPAAFLPVALADIDAAFPAATWARGHAHGELTVECPVKTIPGAVVRIYTTIREQSGHGAGCGGDAFRILAIDTLAEKAGKPACVVNPHNDGPSHFKRVAGWQDRVIDAARGVYAEAVARAAWIAKRRVEAGLVKAAPVVPATPAAPKVTLRQQAETMTATLTAAYASLSNKDRIADVKARIAGGCTATAVAVLLTVYEGQTLAEKQTEQTTEDNGIGFTGVDGQFGASLAKQVLERGTLSPKQTACVLKMTSKYAAQFVGVLCA